MVHEEDFQGEEVFNFRRVVNGLKISTYVTVLGVDLVIGQEVQSKEDGLIVFVALEGLLRDEKRDFDGIRLSVLILVKDGFMQNRSASNKTNVRGHKVSFILHREVVSFVGVKASVDIQMVNCIGRYLKSEGIREKGRKVFVVKVNSSV